MPPTRAAPLPLLRTDIRRCPFSLNTGLVSGRDFLALHMRALSCATSGRCRRGAKEVENLRYELMVVLEDATVSGVGVDPKTGVRQPSGHVLGMLAGDHQVIVAVGNEDRDFDL